MKAFIGLGSNLGERESMIRLALDELSLNDGDWIDISAPLLGRQVFPVTVKSLIFPQN